MAEREPTYEEILAEQAKFQGIPELPKGVEISDRVKSLYADLREQGDARPPSPERDETIQALRDLVNHIKGEIPEPPPGPIETVWGGIGSAHRGDRVDEIGLAIKETRDPTGRLISRYVASREDTEAMKRQIQERVDAREEIKDLHLRARELGELAGMNEAAGADASALREEARALHAEAVTKTQEFKDSIDRSEWRNWDFAAAPPPVDEKVTEALKLLAEGKVDEVYEMSREFDSKQMYQLMNNAGEKHQAAIERMLFQESQERTEAHARARAGGLL
ncbi:MAG TPA: hypothetical protein VEQ37_18030 [Actinomycetota bacterium]|nr:hypothetical protein [Actinomycetota bacterium]